MLRSVSRRVRDDLLPVAIIVSVTICRSIEHPCTRPLITVHCSDRPCPADRKDPTLTPRKSVTVSVVYRTISPSCISGTVTAICPAPVVAAIIPRLILNISVRIRTATVITAVSLGVGLRYRKTQQKYKPYPRKGQLSKKIHISSNVSF